jgi:hypothetical protein
LYWFQRWLRRKNKDALVLPEKVDGIGAAAEAAQHRHDAQQMAWDRKMKALTGTICTGC